MKKSVPYSSHFLINESRTKLEIIIKKLEKTKKEILRNMFSEVEEFLKEVHLSQLYVTYDENVDELYFKFYSQDVKNCEFLLISVEDSDKYSLIIKDEYKKIYHGSTVDLFEDILFVFIDEQKNLTN